MSLTSGTRLGPYEIDSPLGAGGMGEVYRATDTRLGRDVAVKVLPEDFSRDPDRLRRFELEARSASALNHPNILTIHDVGNEDGRAYLVTELLEGRSLREVLDRDDKVPTETALEWGAQICRGLAAAHTRGIVHRDLKPANLFVCKDGRIKILDFGLAKLTLPASGAPSILDQATTLPEMTGEGKILGTVGYMAPEQVRGQPVDARADIFSFGCVVYELLTGERAFHGASALDTLSAILGSEPTLLTEDGPLGFTPQLRRSLARCLAKDPRERWQCAGDLGAGLEQLVREPEVAGGVEGIALGPGRVGTGRKVAIAVASLAAAFAIGFLVRGGEGTGAPFWRAQLTRFYVEPPAGHTFSDFTTRGGPALSPDGRSIVFAAGDAADSTLWLQRLEATGASELAGTEDGSFPFWSPDGTQVGFFADGKLKRLVLATGAIHVVCDAGFALGASWTDGDTILFPGGPGQPIWRVSALGGTPKAVGHLSKGEFMQAWPEALPGGDRFLYTSVILDRDDPHGTRSNALRGARLDGSALGVPKLTGSSHVQFVPPDHLVFMGGQALLARRFNPRSLRFEGRAAVLAEPLLRL